MGCSSWKGSVSRGLLGDSQHALRERNLLETSDTDFLSSFFEC